MRAERAERPSWLPLSAYRPGAGRDRVGRSYGAGDPAVPGAGRDGRHRRRRLRQREGPADGGGPAPGHRDGLDPRRGVDDETDGSVRPGGDLPDPVPVDEVVPVDPQEAGAQQPPLEEAEAPLGYPQPAPVGVEPDDVALGLG